MRVVNKWSKTVVITAMLFLAGMVIGCGSKKEESYRSIQVYDIDGTGWVTREEVGEMELYTNMQLQSHDQLRTDSESYVQLKLDEDKYVLLEPNTRIRIEAEGNEQDSRTKIVLEEGAVVNRIENKLSENSSYEVEAPNSTMAVRGTTFRVTTWEDENGNFVSEIEVQEGKVDCIILIKNTDGTVSEKVVSLEKGKKIIINGILEDIDTVTEPMEYTYDIYENPVLTFIGYSEEEESQDISSDDKKEEMNVDEKEDEKDEENPDDTEKADDVRKNKEEVIPNEPKAEVPVEEVEGETEEIPEEETKNNSENVDNTTNTDNGNGSGSTESGSNTGGGDNSGGTTGGNTGGTTTGGTTTGGTTTGGTTTGGTTTGGTTTGGTTTGGTTGGTTTPASYTVTFKFNDATFATQTVTEGNTATAPLLMPTGSGNWWLADETGVVTTQFDFSTAINAVTTLVWQ